MPDPVLLASASAAVFLDEIRDAITEAGLSVAREERVQLTRVEAAATLQTIAQKATTGTAAPPPAKGKGKDAPPTEPPKAAGPAEVREDQVALLTAGEVLVCHVRASEEGTDVVGRLASLVKGDGGLAVTVREAMVAAAEQEGEAMGSVAVAHAHVERARGVAAQQHLFVSATVESSAAFVESLRRAAVRATSDKERDAMKRARQETARNDWISPEAVMEFAFPPGQLHPKSSGRLIVLATYGPLDEAGHLRGGFHRSRALTDSEIKCMIEQVEEEDLLSVFAKGPPLGPDERLAVLTQIREAKWTLPNMNEEQVTALLSKCGPVSGQGTIRFRALQRQVMQARADRRRRMADALLASLRKHSGSTESVIVPPPPNFGAGTLRPKRVGASPIRRSTASATERISPTVETQGFTPTMNLPRGVGVFPSIDSLREMPTLDKTVASAGRSLAVTSKVNRKLSRNVAAVSTEASKRAFGAGAVTTAMGGGRLPLHRAAASSLGGDLRGGGGGWMRGSTVPLHTHVVSSLPQSTKDGGRVVEEDLGAFLDGLDNATKVAASAGKRAAQRLRKERDAVVVQASTMRHGASRAAAAHGEDALKEMERTAFFDASKKHTALELRKRSEAVMAKNSFQIVTVGEPVSAATLSTNSKLLRHEPPLDKDAWDRNVAFRKPKTVFHQPRVLPGMV
jgi:hypothetical protein